MTDSLHKVRMKLADGSDGEVQHPFASLTALLRKCWAADPGMFEVPARTDQANTAASDFVNSEEYKSHPLVQKSSLDGGIALGLGLYSDGVKVGEDSQPESLYVIYLTFPHLGADACAKPNSKHIFTVYRKSQVNEHTLDDIWDVLLWELQALAEGKEPLQSEFGKPLAAQRPGPDVLPQLGRKLRVCLMQIRGDWAWYAEVL
jgi:hypothetical protein